MKRLGYLLLVVGFLAGSFFAVEQREGVRTVSFLVALTIGAVGVGMARAAKRQEATAADTIGDRGKATAMPVVKNISGAAIAAAVMLIQGTELVSV